MTTLKAQNALKKKFVQQSWDQDSQHLLLCMLLSDLAAFEVSRTILQSEYFDDVYHDAVDFILDYHSNYSTLPAIEQVNLRSEGFPLKKFSEPEKHTAGLLDEVERFCRYKSMELAVIHGVENLETGNPAKIVDDVQTSFEIRLNADKPSFEFVSMEDLDAIEPPEFLIAPWLMVDTVSAIYGAPGTFKSFLCLEASLCLATGRPFNGLPVKRTPVIYVAAEGQRGVAMRVKAWKQHNGVRDLQNSDFLLVTEPVNLLDPEKVATFIRDVQNFEKRLATKYGLLVLDTYSQCVAGEKESSTEVGSAAAAAMIEIRKKLSVTVLFVHHTGKDQERGMRGADSLRANTDAAIEVNRDGSADKLSASMIVKRQKDAPTGHRIPFGCKVVDIPGLEGRSISSSLVVEFGQNTLPGDALTTSEVHLNNHRSIARIMAIRPEPTSVSNLTNRIGVGCNHFYKTQTADGLPLDVWVEVRDETGKAMGGIRRTMTGARSNNEFGIVEFEAPPNKQTDIASFDFDHSITH